MNQHLPIRIHEASPEEQLGDVRRLFRAFVSWHRSRHLHDLILIDEYFDETAFEEELDSLPGSYASPGGRLLLANVDTQPAGCVALRPINDEYCEMKRMFVYPAFQGIGVGRALAKKLVDEAKSIGYRSMMLDTSFRQMEAIKLYESIGFRKIEPYYQLPKKLESWLVFMQLEL